MCEDMVQIVSHKRGSVTSDQKPDVCFENTLLTRIQSYLFRNQICETWKSTFQLQKFGEKW